MLAYVLTRYGGQSAAELRDIPQPEPGPNDVLIQVHAAGLNPVDYKFRNGILRVIYLPHLPLVLGNELAGTVVECGSNVTQFKTGDRVYACCGLPRSGAFAEYACVDSSLLAEIPNHLEMESAAGVPLAGLTALQCLRDQLRVQPRDRLLITGGAGGVGTFAIQIAKWMNAYVVATASPDKGTTLVKELGADEVIDYTRDDSYQTSREFDAVLDLVGGKTLWNVFRAAKKNRRVVSVAGVPEPQTASDLQKGVLQSALFWSISLPIRWKAWRAGVDYRYYFMHPDGPDLKLLSTLIETGHLRPIIDRRFPFTEIAAAIAYLEQGHAKGKVVVQMPAAS